MNETNSFSSKIKDIFFNHRDRFSRETFVITFVALLLFTLISSLLLYELCSLFLPVILVNLIALVYGFYMTYATFVLCIKRLHDLNMTGWISLLLLVPILNILFLAYLCLSEGDPESNSYGDSLNYEGPSFLLYLCYAVLCFQVVLLSVGLFYWSKLRNIQNTAQGVQKMIDILPKKFQEELKDSPRAMGVVFIDDKFTTAGVSITKNRVLVQGINFKQLIQMALLQNKKVVIRFQDDSKANITRLITSDDSLSVQMAVFEMDQDIGTPAKLGDRNRKLLEDINAF